MTGALHLKRDPSDPTLTAAEVWAAIEADPELVEEIRKGGEDIAVGRWYAFDTKTGETTPNPDWPKDGPQPRPRPEDAA